MRSSVFLGIFVCSQSGNHPWESLAKSGNNPEIKYKPFFGSTMKTKHKDD
jgi:hypothetical protein